MAGIKTSMKDLEAGSWLRVLGRVRGVVTGLAFSSIFLTGA
jgi:hypothetical protein